MDQAKKARCSVGVRPQSRSPSLNVSRICGAACSQPVVDSTLERALLPLHEQRGRVSRHGWAYERPLKGTGTGESLDFSVGGRWISYRRTQTPVRLEANGRVCRCRHAFVETADRRARYRTLRNASLASICRSSSCGFAGSMGPRSADVANSSSRICCAVALGLAAQTTAAIAEATVAEKLVPDCFTSLPFGPRTKISTPGA